MTFSSTDTNTTYSSSVVGAQNAGDEILRLDPSSGSNSDIMLKGGTGVNIVRDSAQGLTINAEALVLYDFKAKTTSGTNADPYLALDPSSGVDKSVKIVGSSNVSVTRDSDRQISIASSFSNTTYDLTIPSGSTTLRLDPSAGNNDDIKLKGSGATSITRDSATGLTISSSNTNQLTTFVVEDGDGTERSIAHNKEWKFVEGNGININWTDTSSGTDADPYDLIFNVVTNQSLSIINSVGAFL